jgi:hypothetical protein
MQPTTRTQRLWRVRRMLAGLFVAPETPPFVPALRDYPNTNRR